MENGVRVLALALASAVVVGAPASAADSSLPVWAYPVNPPGTQPAPDDGKPRHVPDSSASFTLTQIRDLFKVPDWHPDDHPPMPEIGVRRKEAGRLRLRLLPSPQRARSPGELQSRGASGRVHRAAGQRFQERRQKELGAEQPARQLDDGGRQGRDRRRGEDCRRLFLLSETHTLDPGRRIRHGPQDPCGRLDAGRLPADRAGTDRPAHHRNAGESRAHRAA